MLHVGALLIKKPVMGNVWDNGRVSGRRFSGVTCNNYMSLEIGNAYF